MIGVVLNRVKELTDKSVYWQMDKKEIIFTAEQH